MHWSKCRRHWSSIMPSTIESVVAKYLRSGNPAQRTHEEFFNYGVDTGTVWKTESFHEPILWRHVSWDRQSPDRDVKEQSPWGWLFYRRIKTDKTFYRPMNRTVHTHIRSIMPENRHYAHRAPLAFKAIMTIPQPSAFSALSKGFDGECPCCRRRFRDAVGSS